MHRRTGLAARLLSAYALFALPLGGCSARYAIDMSSIPGLWAVIGLYVCFVAAGAVCYLAIRLLLRTGKTARPDRMSAPEDAAIGET